MRKGTTRHQLFTASPFTDKHVGPCSSLTKGVCSAFRHLVTGLTQTLHGSREVQIPIHDNTVTEVTDFQLHVKEH